MTQQKPPDNMTNTNQPPLPNPAKQIIVGVSLYMRGDGTVVWQKAPGSPQEPDLNAVHTLATRAVRDTELRLIVEGVTQRQVQIAQHMRQTAEEQRQAQEEGHKEALRQKAAERQETANTPAE